MKLTLLALLAVFLVGCGSTATAPDDTTTITQKSGECWIWHRGEIHGPYDCDNPPDVDEPVPCFRIVGLRTFPCE